MLTSTSREIYRKLTIGDEALLVAAFSGAGLKCDELDDRCSSLVRVAAAIAIKGDFPAIQREVRDAIGAGASMEQITDVMLAIARIIGSAGLMSGAPKVAMALGYDVDAGLENHLSPGPEA